jgi:hypothetical protein
VFQSFLVCAAAGGISSLTAPGPDWRHEPGHGPDPLAPRSMARAAGTPVRSGGLVGPACAASTGGVSAVLVVSVSDTAEPLGSSGLGRGRPGEVAPAPGVVSGPVSARGGAISPRSRSCGGAA